MSLHKPVALIVDSEEGHRLQLKDHFTAAGFDSWFFSDGIKLFKFLDAQGLKIRASFYLIDVSSPKLSGFEICRRLHSLPRSSDTPILMMAKHCTPEDKLEAQSAGALTCLQKPITLSVLKYEITRRKLRDTEMKKAVKERFKVTFG